MQARQVIILPTEIGNQSSIGKNDLAFSYQVILHNIRFLNMCLAKETTGEVDVTRAISFTESIHAEDKLDKLPENQVNWITRVLVDSYEQLGYVVSNTAHEGRPIIQIRSKMEE